MQPEPELPVEAELWRWDPLHPAIPQFDGQRCITCEDCLRVCPTSCLRVIGYVPAVTRERDCISCGVCAAVCPTTAISPARAAW